MVENDNKDDRSKPLRQSPDKQKMYISGASNPKPIYFSSSAETLSKLKTQVNELKIDRGNSSRFFVSSSSVKNNKSETIDQKIRRQQIDNDNKEKDQKLKEKTLYILFTFLSVETLIIFSLAFVQGFKFLGFSLDAWSFRLVVAGTLGQIATMLTIAVRHLFPRK